MSTATHTVFGDLADFIDATYAPEDTLLRDLKAQTRQRGLPPIQVPPALGKLLALFVKITGAHRILEIGTLAGYSAIWMARALPANGRVVSLEVEPAHKQRADEFLRCAGLADRVDVHLGPALATLAQLPVSEPFDMAFLDADKEVHPHWLLGGGWGVCRAGTRREIRCAWGLPKAQLPLLVWRRPVLTTAPRGRGHQAAARPVSCRMPETVALSRNMAENLAAQPRAQSCLPAVRGAPASRTSL